VSKENTLSEEGKLFVTFSSYLDKIRSEQGQLPPDQRKPVPTIRELAHAINTKNESKIHEMTLYNIVNNNIQLLNLQTARMMMDEMHNRGFNINISDFLKYIPPHQ
jgi:hypothetical protein